MEGCRPGVRARTLLRWLYVPLALQTAPVRTTTPNSGSVCPGCGRGGGGKCEASCPRQLWRELEACHAGDGWTPLHRASADASGVVAASLVAAVGLETQAAATRMLWRRTHDTAALTVLDVAALMVRVRAWVGVAWRGVAAGVAHACDAVLTLA